MSIEISDPGVELPDLPSVVHGIKSKDPWTVQCDDCLRCWSGPHGIIVLGEVIFNSRAKMPGLRLCADCWEKRGWANSASRGWEWKEKR